MQLLRDDTDAWWAVAEAMALGYDTELAAYKREHPMPQLKTYLIHMKGLHQRP